MVTTFSGTACKKQVSSSRTAYVIGEDNMESIDQSSDPYVKYKDTIESTVLIVTQTPTGGAQFCSGALVQGKTSLRILTNHHCFAIKGENNLATPTLLSTACQKTKVYFNVIQGALDAVTRASCIEGSLINDFNADLASFSIQGQIPANIRPLDFYESNDVENRAAFIIHYPSRADSFAFVKSAGGRLPVATLTEDDCKINGRFPESEWRQLPVLSVSYRHECDLIQGSSGSPLVDLESRKLIGVNWGGIQVKTGSDLRVDNAATSAQYAKEFILSEGAPNRVSSLLTSIVAKSKQEAASSEEDDKPSCGSISSFLGSSKENSDSASHSLLLVFLLAPTFFSIYYHSKKRYNLDS